MSYPEILMNNFEMPVTVTTPGIVQVAPGGPVTFYVQDVLLTTEGKTLSFDATLPGIYYLRFSLNGGKFNEYDVPEKDFYLVSAADTAYTTGSEIIDRSSHEDMLVARIDTTVLPYSILSYQNTGSGSISNSQPFSLVMTDENGDIPRELLDPSNLTAARLETARAIQLTGDATGSAQFDGSSDAQITVSVLHAARAARLDGFLLALGGDMSGAVAIDGTTQATLVASLNPSSHGHDERYYTQAVSDARFVGLASKNLPGGYVGLDLSTGKMQVDLLPLEIINGTSISMPWLNVTSKPDLYTKQELAWFFTDGQNSVRVPTIYTNAVRATSNTCAMLLGTSGNRNFRFDGNDAQSGAIDLGTVLGVRGSLAYTPTDFGIKDNVDAWRLRSDNVTTELIGAPSTGTIGLVGNPTVSGVTTLHGSLLSTASASFTGTVSAQEFLSTSSRDSKVLLGEAPSALGILRSTDVVSFHFKGNPDRPKIGIIAEDSPDLLTGPDRKTFDIYNAIGLLIKAVQELDTKIEVRDACPNM